MRFFAAICVCSVVACSGGSESRDPPTPIPTPSPSPDATACLADPANAPLARPTPVALHDTLTRIVRERPVASAAIGVARGDEVLWLEGFGLADPSTGAPATAATPFAIASVSKVVVATAVMQLVERGLVDLDADVGVVAPELGVVRNPAFPDTAITTRMLLTHTSTLWDVPFTYDATWVSQGDSPIAMRDFVVGYFTPSSPYFGGSDAWWSEAPPGRFSCYSNMGIGAAAVLLEQVTGKSLDDYARTHIFAPLGMNDTSFRLDAFCPEAMLARGSKPGGAVAGGFVDDNLGAETNAQPEGHPEIASGMLRTSARDLLRFTMALANGGELEGARILARETTATMLARQLTADVTACGDGRSDPAQQALGITHLPDASGVDWAGHYGGMNGFSSALWLDPAPNGLRYVVLMNQLDLDALGAIEVALLEAASAR